MQLRLLTTSASASALLLAAVLAPGALAQPPAGAAARPASGPLEDPAPVMPRAPAAVAPGLQWLELTAGGQRLTNGYGPWRELALRGAYGLPGHLLQGELSMHRRFGEDGAYLALSDTHAFDADWFGSAAVGFGDGAFYLPRYRVDLTLSRKWLARQSLVTSAGLGYYKAPDGHTDRSLLLGAAYYFEAPWIVEGGLRFNRSDPGSVRTSQRFVALTYGRPKEDLVTARVGWGGEGYLATGPASQLVNFRSREASVSWRHWFGRHTALIAGANHYRNPLYRRTGLTVGLLHEF